MKQRVSLIFLLSYLFYRGEGPRRNAECHRTYVVSYRIGFELGGCDGEFLFFFPETQLCRFFLLLFFFFFFFFNFPVRLALPERGLSLSKKIFFFFFYIYLFFSAVSWQILLLGIFSIVPFVLCIVLLVWPVGPPAHCLPCPGRPSVRPTGIVNQSSSSSLLF